jgi:hypothetical protein
MKKCLLRLAVALFLATVSTPATLLAEDPAPTCGPDGCQKPGVQVLLPGTQNDPAPTCGPDGCQKPGVQLLLPGTQNDPAPTCGPNGCQKPGLA